MPHFRQTDPNRTTALQGTAAAAAGLHLPGSRFGIPTKWSIALRRLRSNLPQGRLLPEPAWQKRHDAIVVLLSAHAIGLVIFGWAMGYGLAHSILETSPVAVCMVIASSARVSRKLRAGFASFGLITCSALLVHFWGGAIEAHFHFFFVIGVLTLYQDWFPFLLALLYVVLHHGLMGALDPGSVYNHPAAVEDPWKWAIIHAIFVLAASAANLVTWRVNEQLLKEPLTGLPGRNVFMDRLAQSLARLDRHPSTVAVIFLDLDRFKLINDSLGHHAGDRMLVTVAQRLGSMLRRQDSVARLGGDEFAILCQDLGGERSIVATANRVNEVVGEPMTINGHEVQTSASVGIALTTDPNASPVELMRNADVAMYRAKERAAGSCEVFDESMHARVVQRMETESGLRRALAQNEFRLVYQPEVSLETGRMVAVEALLRWDRPGRGTIAPLDFIPVAEDTGLIVPIGDWVIQEGCRQAACWRQERPDREPLRMRVNLSPRQLAGPDLLKTVSQAMEDTGMNPADLDLELTESTMMNDVEWAITALTALKDLGLRLSVDDFGTGHSSLSYLKDFPVDTLKVDRSFVHSLGEGPSDSAIVASIVDVAHALGLSVTAEGVEHERQLQDLKDIGCDNAQGFYLARPQPPEAISELLAQERRDPYASILAEPGPAPRGSTRSAPGAPAPAGT